MSDNNKIIAAILTAGRMPTFKQENGPRSMEDWLAEYTAWLQTLNSQDEAEKKQSASKYAASLTNI